MFLHIISRKRADGRICPFGVNSNSSNINFHPLSPFFVIFHIPPPTHSLSTTRTCIYDVRWMMVIATTGRVSLPCTSLGMSCRTSTKRLSGLARSLLRRRIILFRGPTHKNNPLLSPSLMATNGPHVSTYNSYVSRLVSCVCASPHLLPMSVCHTRALNCPIPHMAVGVRALAGPGRETTHYAIRERSCGLCEEEQEGHSCVPKNNLHSPQLKQTP